MALTLRLVCGLTTAEVARAFLVSETTMAARITRAKKKIAAARIPYRVPPVEELPDRNRRRAHRRPPAATRPVTPPRSAPTWSGATWWSGRSTWPACCDQLLPDDAEVAGLLALVLLTDARGATRSAVDGRLPSWRTRTGARWDRAAIAEGTAPGPRGTPATAAGPVRPHGRHRRRARRGSDLGGHGLGRDRRSLRPAGTPSGRRPSSPSTAPSPWDSRRGPRPGWPLSTPWPASLTGHLQLPRLRSGRLPAPAGPHRRGGRVLPCGTGAERQRRGGRIPPRSPRRCGDHVGPGADRWHGRARWHTSDR